MAAAEKEVNRIMVADVADATSGSTPISSISGPCRRAPMMQDVMLIPACFLGGNLLVGRMRQLARPLVPLLLGADSAAGRDECAGGTGTVRSMVSIP